jgi:hypothetical protein
MSVFDHLPIIEVIAKYLKFKDLQSLILVSRQCARFFKESNWMKGYIEEELFIEAIIKQIKINE